MRAVLCRAFGPPETLTLESIDKPVPGPGEVLVAVKAAALNFFDTLVIQNRYQVKPPMPFSPSAECAGVVAALGPGVTAPAIGTRVIASTGFNAAREFTLARPGQLTPIPDGLDDVRASGLTITYGTTLHALKDRAKLQPGETLAVLGASGGVGLAAVEIGKLMGARVIACASSADKVAFARQMGADEGIDYGSEDLKNRLKELTGGKGVDVIYDPVGDRLAEPALRSIAWIGRYLVIGFAGGEIPRIPLNLALLKGCDILGVFWGAFVEKEPAANQANMRQLMAWAASGALSAHVHGTYPLEKAAEAMGVLARREARGKVVLVP